MLTPGFSIHSLCSTLKFRISNSSHFLQKKKRWYFKLRSITPIYRRRISAITIIVNSDAVIKSANDIMQTGIAESGRLTTDQIITFLQATLFAHNRN